jgi:hypothetical protein
VFLPCSEAGEDRDINVEDRDIDVSDIENEPPPKAGSNGRNSINNQDQQRKALYHQSKSKRRPPSAANRKKDQSDWQYSEPLPPLNGQKQQQIMVQTRRTVNLSGEDDKDEEEDLQSLPNVPRKKKGDLGTTEVVVSPTDTNSGLNLHEYTKISDQLKKLPKQEQARLFKRSLELYLKQFEKSDKEKTKPQLAETVLKLRTEFFNAYRKGKYAQAETVKLEKNLEDLGTIIEEKEEIIEQKDKIILAKNQRIADLKTKLAKAIANKAHSKTVGSALKVNKAILGKVKEYAMGFLWSMCKFMQNKEEEQDACGLLFQIGNFETVFEGTKPKHADLVETYSVACRRALFYKRNYCTSETKKVFMMRKTKGKFVLSVEDLIMCLERKIESEEDMEKFMVYWDEYLPKHVGASEWGQRVAYYVTISRAMRKDYPQLPLITPEDEAFCVLCVHNGIARWTKEFDAGKTGDEAAGNAGDVEAPEQNIEQQETNSDGQEDGDGEVTGGKYDGLFTKTTTGQNHYGGWQAEGLELFNEYRDKNKEARKDKNCDIVEKNCLKLLRIRNGIEEDCTNAEQHARNKEAKKRMKKRGLDSAPLPPTKKAVRTLILPSYQADNGVEDDSEEE